MRKICALLIALLLWPGGVPLFKNGHIVGGIGVAGASADVAEFAAFSAARVSHLLDIFPLPPPGVVVIDGIELLSAILHPQGHDHIHESIACRLGPLPIHQHP